MNAPNGRQVERVVENPWLKGVARGMMMVASALLPFAIWMQMRIIDKQDMLQQTTWAVERKMIQLGTSQEALEEKIGDQAGRADAAILRLDARLRSLERAP